MGLALRAGRPGEKESAEEGDAGGEGETQESGDETFLQARAGHEEGAHHDRVERENAEEKRDRSGEFE